MSGNFSSMNRISLSPLFPPPLPLLPSYSLSLPLPPFSLFPLLPPSTLSLASHHLPPSSPLPFPLPVHFSLSLSLFFSSFSPFLLTTFSPIAGHGGHAGFSCHGSCRGFFHCSLHAHLLHSDGDTRSGGSSIQRSGALPLDKPSLSVGAEVLGRVEAPHEPGIHKPHTNSSHDFRPGSAPIPHRSSPTSLANCFNLPTTRRMSSQTRFPSISRRFAV